MWSLGTSYAFKQHRHRCLMCMCVPEGGGAFVAERAEQLLRAAAATGLQTRVQCLEHLGRHFRGALELPARLTDLQVGSRALYPLQP